MQNSNKLPPRTWTLPPVRPLTFSILRLLSDGAFRSGEEMAGAFGVSRGTVSNALRDAGELGLALHKVPGRGYQLAAPVEWLERDRVAWHLGPRADRFRIEIHDSIASTSSVLMDEALQGAPSRTVVVAEHQAEGRGRAGRPWHAGLGGCLLFSLLWRFDRGVAGLSGLSLAVGLGLVRALREAGAPVMMKWPNDVLYDYLKLAGILVELHGDALGPAAVVIGIGINTRLPPGVRDRIDQPVTDLASACGRAPDRSRLLARCLVELDDVLGRFDREGFAGLRDEWTACHAYQGRHVRLLLPDRTAVEGEVRGVDPDGTLVLATPAGDRRFPSGEISLRAAP